MFPGWNLHFSPTSFPSEHTWHPDDIHQEAKIPRWWTVILTSESPLGIRVASFSPSLNELLLCGHLLIICEWECEEGGRGKWDKTENLLFFFFKIRKLFIPSKVPEEINSVGSSCYSSPSRNDTTDRVLLMQIFKINLSFITEEW